MTDEYSLLQDAQNGDYDAFELLHRSLEPAIMRFVRRLIGHNQEAEDIVQDTFIALYLHMSKIDSDQGVRPYVFRIARNKCYDVLRRQGRYEAISLDDDDDPVNIRISFDLAQSNGVSPEDSVHWLLLQLEVQEAMESLPELQRQALILYSEEQLSYPEIAEIMDVSVGTIKSRIFHAKKNLRARMNPETLATIQHDLR